MTTQSPRIVLRPEALLSTLVEYAKSHGWELAEARERAHSQPGRTFWRVQPEGEVGWFEEHIVGVRFFWVNKAPDVEPRLRAILPHYSRQDLLAEAESDDLLIRLQAMRALSILEEMVLSPELRGLLLGLIDHPNRVVRRAILHLCWVGAWKELLPEIEQRATVDADLSEGWMRLSEGLKKVHHHHSQP